MSALTESIKELYNGEISDGEAELATSNLLELFRIFAQVDTRTSKTRTVATEHPSKRHKEHTSKQVLTHKIKYIKIHK